MGPLAGIIQVTCYIPVRFHVQKYGTSGNELRFRNSSAILVESVVLTHTSKSANQSILPVSLIDYNGIFFKNDERVPLFLLILEV